MDESVQLLIAKSFLSKYNNEVANTGCDFSDYSKDIDNEEYYQSFFLAKDVYECRDKEN